MTLRCLCVILASLVVLPATARPTLVCRITARVPFTAAHFPGNDNSRIFAQTATLLEERQSGTSLIHLWTVIADTPDQLVAVDPARSLTLLINRPGGSFSESGVQVQRRGFCRINDLP